MARHHDLTTLGWKVESSHAIGGNMAGRADIFRAGIE